MVEPGPSLPFFSRVEAGRVRSYAGPGCGRTEFARAWETVGAARILVPSASVPEGFLPHHLLALNLGGDGVLECAHGGGDWEVHRLAHHSVSVFPATVPHALRPQQPGDVLFVELLPEFAQGLLGDAGAAAALRTVPVTQDEFSTHVLLALGAEARAGTPSSASRAEKLAGALLSYLSERELRADPVAPAVSLPSPKLRRVLEHIATHLDAPLSLQTLADLAEMDVFRFTRAFKQATSSSPHRYVLEARISRAKDLLADRRLSITDVALQTGFATPSHFSVTFRRITQLTPRAFRDGLR